MDLEIKDVADLLNIPQSTVEAWVSQEQIPHYRIGDSCRFSRMEIEDWVLKNSDRTSPYNPQPQQGAAQYSLYRAIHNGAVLHQVPGDDKYTVIRNAMALIAKDFALDADVLIDLIIDRERLEATGIGQGIGLPHTRDSFIHAPCDRVVVAFPETPIVDYGALDGKAVHTLFFLFARNDKQHLHLLAKIAHFSNDEASKNQLLNQPTKSHLLEYLRDWEAAIGR